MNLKLLKIIGITLLIFSINSCKGGDARKYPPQPELRVKKNLEEGRGFRLNDTLNKTFKGGGGTFDESIKITVRFLSNEVRSDALDIKVFFKKCADLINCKITESEGNLGKELKKEILKKAAIYKKQTKDKKFKPYSNDLD